MLYELLTILAMAMLYVATQKKILSAVIPIVLFTVKTSAFWIASCVSYSYMWEMSALGFIDDTSPKCENRNGGIWEKDPGRLTFPDWIGYWGCLGRLDGYENPLMGMMVLAMLAFFAVALFGIVSVALTSLPRFEKTYLRLKAVYFFLRDVYIFLVMVFTTLAGFFVVPKPVEPNQGVLLTVPDYNRLRNENLELTEKVLKYKATVESLEVMNSCCALWHMTPDATKMKTQHDQLERSNHELKNLRRDHFYLQNTCQTLRDEADLVKRADLSKLQAEIDSLQPKNVAKAAEERDQAMASSHAKEKSDLEKKIINLEAALVQAQSKGEKKTGEDIAVVKADYEKKYQEQIELKDRQTEDKIADVKADAEELFKHRILLKDQEADEKVASTKADAEKRFLVRYREARKEITASTEADISAKWKRRFDEEIVAARKESAEAAEAEISAKWAARRDSEFEAFRKELAEAAEAEKIAIRKEFAEAAEADKKTRASNRRKARARRALAREASLEAPVEGGVPDEPFPEFNDADFPDSDPEWYAVPVWPPAAVAEYERKKAEERRAAAGGAGVSSSGGDTEMTAGLPDTRDASVVVDAPDSPLSDPPDSPEMEIPYVPMEAPQSTDPHLNTVAPIADDKVMENSGGRKRATGRVPRSARTLDIPDHVLAHAKAQSAAANEEAFAAGKFWESNAPNKYAPMQGERQRVGAGATKGGGVKKRQWEEEEDAEAAEGTRLHKRHYGGTASGRGDRVRPEEMAPGEDPDLEIYKELYDY